MTIKDSKYYLIDLDGVILDTNYDNYFWQKYIPLQRTRSVMEYMSRITLKIPKNHTPT